MGNHLPRLAGVSAPYEATEAADLTLCTEGVAASATPLVEVLLRLSAAS